MKKQATEGDEMATAEALREQAAQHERNAQESYERSDTDGFLSQWASGINAQVARRQADIVEAGGVATLGVLRLETLEGERVEAKMIRGRYGECWAICDEAGDFTGEFVTARPARESTLAKKGYREVEEEVVAEVEADTWAPAGARGLGGATQVQVVTQATDRKLRGRNVRVICLGELDEEG